MKDVLIQDTTVQSQHDASIAAGGELELAHNVIELSKVQGVCQKLNWNAKKH